jgi:hypothetical protein
VLNWRVIHFDKKKCWKRGCLIRLTYHVKKNLKLHCLVAIQICSHFGLLEFNFAGWRGQVASSWAARALAATTRTPCRLRRRRRRPPRPTRQFPRRCRPPPRFRTGPRCRRRPSSPPRPACPTFLSSCTGSTPELASPEVRPCLAASLDFSQVQFHFT